MFVPHAPSLSCEYTSVVPRTREQKETPPPRWTGIVPKGRIAPVVHGAVTGAYKELMERRGPHLGNPRFTNVGGGTTGRVDVDNVAPGPEVRSVVERTGGVPLRHLCGHLVRPPVHCCRPGAPFGEERADIRARFAKQARVEEDVGRGEKEEEDRSSVCERSVHLGRPTYRTAGRWCHVLCGGNGAMIYPCRLPRV